ncbi:rCG54691 [Rattus norvegicus]|uniref:RCG54691 n=1 Tax=Rattus norvegicus TaxID=10116 RepID=A6KFM1_RAT|nr:rCG54691 [Rattus norvegicus]
MRTLSYISSTMSTCVSCPDENGLNL